MGELTLFLQVTSLDDRRILTMKEQPSQPGGQYKDKETDVDIRTLGHDIRTEGEPRKSVEPIKESQFSPDSPAPTLRRSARNRKPPTYLSDFVSAMN